MSKKNTPRQETADASTFTAPKPKATPELDVVYYENLHFARDFAMSLGMSFATKMGALEGSTSSRPTRYSARWIVGSPVVSIRWQTQKGKVTEYDVPWTQIMGATRIPEGDEPAPLSKR